VTYSRRTIENPSDRAILEQSEAREIFRTWQTNQDRDFVRGRLERSERIYGKGSKDRIRNYMNNMKDGLIL
jgi:hypothetical protein